MFCFSNCPHSSSDTLEVSSVTTIGTASTSKVTQLVATSPTKIKTFMVPITNCHLKKISITWSLLKLLLKGSLTQFIPIWPNSEFTQKKKKPPNRVIVEKFWGTWLIVHMSFMIKSESIPRSQQKSKILPESTSLCEKTSKIWRIFKDLQVNASVHYCVDTQK